MSSDVFDDLAAEQNALDEILVGLPEAAWRSPSAAAGWVIGDVVLHLAQTEELACAAARSEQAPEWRRYGDNVDDAMAALVRTGWGAPAELLARWRAACGASMAALRRADPKRRVPWVASSVKPASLATTRLAEHWAHALDITGPLDIAYPDTARLRHIAWLGHQTLPYAFKVGGLEPCDIRCDLLAPDGTRWRYGPSDADSSISGTAAAFCRVGAHRLAPDESGLIARGPRGNDALRLLRNYAYS